MDAALEKRLDVLLDKARSWAGEEFSVDTMDPVAKLMLAAVLSESQSIKDTLDSLGERVADFYLENFIPRNRVGPMPALAIVEPFFKQQKMAEGTMIESGAVFTYKMPQAKQPLSYIPIFRTYALPVNELYWLAGSGFHVQDSSRRINMTKEKGNILWLGINSAAEIDCLKGLSLLFRKTGGVSPVKISVGNSGHELSFASMDRMAEIEMVEPFDAQQSSECMFSFMKEWRETLLEMQEISLIYLTDPIRDRDLFKPKPYPSVFQFCLMSEDLDAIKANTLWLKIVFPDGYQLPEECEVIVNAFPVANIDVCQVILTQASPVAKLQKQDDSFFLSVLETSNHARQEGFDLERDEYIIRDFEANCYHDGDLYRDVRNLYHHFVEDYYAFQGYNGIKDGELLKQLREAFNKIGKSVGSQNEKFKFDSGTYAMKNINQTSKSAATKVSYITTKGRLGNAPRDGDKLENKRHLALEKDVRVVVSACCGRDKMTADERYEQMRYFTLTGDRLYTKMDIDAYLRKEIMSEFGVEEFPRIGIKITVQGAGGSETLRRGIYIDILFKDNKNYNRAQDVAFAAKMQQRIINKSCLSMPVIVKLVNLEG